MVNPETKKLLFIIIYAILLLSFVRAMWLLVTSSSLQEQEKLHDS